MALLYVTEYAEMQIGPAGRTGQMPMEPPLIADQVVVIGGGSLQSAVFNSKTRFVRLHSDAICNVLVGTNPTALANSSGRMAANQTEYRAVPLTGTYRVAVIAAAV